MKKNKSNFRIDIIIIFVILLLGPATGLLLSKTNLLDKIQFLNILRPNVYVYEPIALNYEDEIKMSKLKKNCLKELNLNSGKYSYYSIQELSKEFPEVNSLPFSLIKLTPISRVKSSTNTSLQQPTLLQNIASSSQKTNKLLISEERREEQVLQSCDVSFCILLFCFLFSFTSWVSLLLFLCAFLACSSFPCCQGESELSSS